MTGNVAVGKEISIMMIRYQAMDLQVQSLPDYISTLVMSVMSKDLNLSEVHSNNKMAYLVMVLERQRSVIKMGDLFQRCFTFVDKFLMHLI